MWSVGPGAAEEVVVGIAAVVIAVGVLVLNVTRCGYNKHHKLVSGKCGHLLVGALGDPPK